MQIHLVGFEWKLPGNTPISTLCDHLVAKSGTETMHNKYRRVLYAVRSKGRTVGVLLTIKNQRKFASINVRTYRISIQSLQAGTSLVDFNFFVLNEKSGKGIYSYYHNSCGVSAFNAFIQTLFSVHQQERLEAVLKQEPNASKSRRKELRRAFPAVMDAGQIVRQETLPQILALVNKIKLFEYDATMLVTADKLVRSLEDVVASRRVRVRIIPDLAVGTVAQRIVDFVNRNGITSGRIEAEDDDEEKQIIKLVNTPDVFGTYEFDKVVSDAMIDYEAIGDSPFLATMGKVMNHHGVHFEQRSQ